jgi:peptidoglycan/xylan/chitin deacetylase (PgdA/CDA1 family)
VNELSTLESWLIRIGGTLLSRRGKAASLLVMIYHRVLRTPDPMLPSEPDAGVFAAQMDLVGRHFNVLPLREAAARLARGALPPRAVAISFDDGYANNCDVALPILAARRLPATVFIAAGFLNGGRMFNDTVIEAVRRAPPELDLRPQGLEHFHLRDVPARLRAVDAILANCKYLPPEKRLRCAAAITARVGAALPDDLMMTDAQVVRLSRAGIEIGAHTMNHPILARIDSETARREICASKQRLEDLTGGAVTSFAYPNGKPAQDYNHSHVALVREAGFDVALTTVWGAATAATDRLQMPRIAPWDRDARRYALRMVSAYRQRRFAAA